jgi:hypothetical protein
VAACLASASFVVAQAPDREQVLLSESVAQAAPADDPEPSFAPSARNGAPVEGRFIVRLAERSYDLEVLRDAIRSGVDAATYAGLVDGVAEAAKRDQAPLVARIEQLGGRVAAQYWIVDGLCVEGLDERTLSELPGVAFVDPVRIWSPTNNTARNANNHDAVGAEQRQNASGELIRGTGLSVAVLDTGVDADFNGSGIPHPALFPDGNTSLTTGGGIAGSRLRAALSGAGGIEDLHGHGSHVMGSVASGWSSYRGIARDASIVSVKVAVDDSTGDADSAAILFAWQLVFQNRIAYDIRSANNSYSGSPSLTSPVQEALDNAAFYGDVFVAVSAGNSGSNTASSQNAWNGLAVGAVRKDTFSTAGFSARGPLAGMGRTFPDIAGIGVNVVSMRPDSTNSRTLSGTSMASPMIAGSGALVRHANPALSSGETKAILLNTTKGPQNDRNARGLGVADCDAAVVQALAGDVHTTLVSDVSPVTTRTFTVPGGGSKSLTAVWMRPGGAGPVPNVDLRVFAGGSATPVASDLNPLNSYEHVEFTAQAGVTYTLELTWANPEPGRTVEVAVAGLPPLPTVPPTLASVAPTSVNQAAGEAVLLTGTGLESVTSVAIDGVASDSFRLLSATQIEITLPVPTTVGTIQLSVTNPLGTSNSVSLQVVGTSPPVLVAPEQIAGGETLRFDIYGMPGDVSVLWLSPSPVPSIIPGLIDLGLGNAFTLLFQVASLPHDPGTGTATLSIPLPPLSVGGFFYFQALTVPGVAPVLPFPTTDVKLMLITVGG